MKHNRYGYPVPRITPCATSCIKRVTPTSRSRLINVCEEHTSTASSFRLDRPERPTLVRKRSPRYQRIRFLLPSSLLPLLLCTESTKRRSKTLCRSRQRVLGEQLTGANVQFMHLDVTRIASHYIASADVLHLDQCFSAKALTLMRTLMRHMRLLEPAPFSLPLTAFHTPYYTPYRLHSVIHDHASGRLVPHGLQRQSACHRGGTVTQHDVTLSR